MTKKKPNADIFEAKRECLAEIKALSEKGAIDVYYGDESGVSLVPNVPYGWQFLGEVVTMPSEKGGHLNCFALLARNNRCFVQTTEAKVTGDWVAEQITAFAQTLRRLTVIVLNNASLHHKAVKEHQDAWEEKGLFSGSYRPTRRTSTSPRFSDANSSMNGCNQVTTKTKKHCTVQCETNSIKSEIHSKSPSNPPKQPEPF